MPEPLEFPNERMPFDRYVEVMYQTGANVMGYLADNPLKSAGAVVGLTVIFSLVNHHGEWDALEDEAEALYREGYQDPEEK